jgi:hypothetical protein
LTPAGVFPQAGGVNVSKTGRWVVSLNLAGEMYQALFETQVSNIQAMQAPLLLIIRCALAHTTS